MARAGRLPRVHDHFASQPIFVELLLHEFLYQPHRLFQDGVSAVESVQQDQHGPPIPPALGPDGLVVADRLVMPTSSRRKPCTLASSAVYVVFFDFAIVEAVFGVERKIRVFELRNEAFQDFANVENDTFFLVPHAMQWNLGVVEELLDLAHELLVEKAIHALEVAPVEPVLFDSD